MITEEFMRECCARVWREPIAIKLQVPYWITATKSLDRKWIRRMTLLDDEWMFFVLPKKTPEGELRGVLTVLSAFCIGECYFI